VLFGVAVLNGVALVSCISQWRQQGSLSTEAVAAACHFGGHDTPGNPSANRHVRFGIFPLAGSRTNLTTCRKKNQGARGV